MFSNIANWARDTFRVCPPLGLAYNAMTLLTLIPGYSENVGQIRSKSTVLVYFVLLYQNTPDWLLYEEKVFRAGEVAEVVKYLAHKHEHLILNLQNLC